MTIDFLSDEADNRTTFDFWAVPGLRAGRAAVSSRRSTADYFVD